MLDLKMVEAVGFEPTSENLQPEARYMLVPSFKSRLIRRLRESFGIGQPGFSYPPAPDGVGQTSLVCDVSAAVQAPAAKRASLN